MKRYLMGVAAVLAALAGAGAANAGPVTGRVDKVVLEHNVNWQGKKGLAIHVESTFSNAYGTKNVVVATLVDVDGNPVAGISPSFRDENGNLKVTDPFTAKYFTTIKTSMLFIPYDEIDLGRGKHSLTIKISLMNESGSWPKVLAEKDEYITFTR